MQQMESYVTFENIFKNLGIRASREQVVSMQRYVSLLVKWNARINLIASNKWALIEPLLQEGIWAAKIYPNQAKVHLDIGSGAGFPAIPIGITIPGIKIDMIDSRLKRVQFLATVAAELRKPDICAHHGRVDQFLDKIEKAWDCISWKGLRMRTEDILKLREHAHQNTQFWIFHGKELAVKEPDAVENILRLLRREKFPYKTEWMLSVYIPR